MKATALICPNCGAPVDSRNRFCSQCGTPIRIDDNAQKLQYTYQQVDDARIREADVRETVRLKELELELFRLQDSAKQKILGLWIRLGVVFLLLITMGILLFVAATNKDFNDTCNVFSFMIMITLAIAVPIMFRNTRK